MKLPKTGIPVYGDPTYRGPCPNETVEQVTLVSRIRKTPYGILLVHVRNEGKRTQYQAMQHKAEGMTRGASDIIIPGSPAFVCELKRRDITKSAWQEGQEDYLLAALDAGAFACVALGCDAAWEAFLEWQSVIEKSRLS